ncbi:MAG: DegT/DnrJ/EryC1/StrS family aminotransferase [Candidatus Omnitrophota bacterium]|jgi:dTDP-4-amino-4,6-dideoxygalactose transaminase|nr:MAG: DegT/DnrJ/EryC1/StrS family aminotransferase [Candidatus Omnitrophota bacterium]
MPGPGAYWIGEEEKKEVLDVLESGHVNRYGDLDDPRFKQKVLTLEKEFAQYCGAKYCVATSSGTSTLLISLNTIGVKPGDEIIIPTYTFIASFGAPIFLGAVPVLAEIDESLCIDPADIERRITPKTKAIMPVHILGNPCAMDAIMDIANKHGLPVVEDCCQACGASYHGKKVGTFGELGGYSLNIFKTITAGDGGMLITNNDEHYQRAFSMQDQGYKKQGGRLAIISPSILGLNFRINELTGAFALAQLRKLDKIIATLREKKRKFKELITGGPGYHFRTLNDPDGDCGTLLTVIFDSREKAAKVSQALGTTTVDDSGWHVYSNMDQIVRYLQSVGQPGALGDFPRTDNLLKRSINLSVGVVDAGLGSAFGIDINSTDEEIKQAADRFLHACAAS